MILGTIEGATSDESSPSDAGSSTDPIVPSIPGYRLLKPLGQGGMGQVYLAEHAELNRKVAIKLLAAGASVKPQALNRFQAEARAVATIDHPGICEIFEAGQAGGLPFLAIEYIDGPTLAEVVREQLPNPDQAARYVLAIAQAMEASHAAGILHRDLKPANIMLDRHGVVKVMDFGLAKRLGDDQQQTKTGEILGTPAYMAPEQASGVVRQLGPTCDIYAMGTILYELLTGRPPFMTPDAMQTVLMVLTNDPTPPRQLQPKIPLDLQTICLKCLEKKPKKRYLSAAELAADLQRFLDRRPILARRTSAPEKLLKWAGRNPATAALVAVAGLAVAAAAGGTAFHVTTLQTELQRSGRLLNGMTEFGEWLVREHVPRIARLRGGSQQQAELVDRTVQYLHQIQQDAAADDDLVRYVAQAYLQIADVQAHPAFATAERLQQAIESAENAVDLYATMPEAEQSAETQTHHAAALLRLSELHAALGLTDPALALAEQAIDRLPIQPPATKDVETHLVRFKAQFQRLQLTASELKPAIAWKRFTDLHDEVSKLTDGDSESLRLLAQLQIERQRFHPDLHVSDSQSTASQSSDESAVPSRIELCESAVEHCRAIRERDPMDSVLLAEASAMLATAFAEARDLAAATDAVRQAIDAQRSAGIELPESIRLLQILLHYQQYLFALDTLPPSDAEQLAAAHHEDAQQLARLRGDAADPALGTAFTMLAKSRQQRGHFAEARDYLRQAIAIAGVAGDDPAGHNVTAEPLKQRNLFKQSYVSDRPSDSRLQLANLYFQLAHSFTVEVQQRSTIQQTQKLLLDAKAAIDTSIDFFSAVQKAADYPEDSVYWQAISLQHDVEGRLEQIQIQRRESSAVQSPEKDPVLRLPE
ncbi:MAG: hypothetical protein Fues2KO_11630 [Fuerstiella sp.]